MRILFICSMARLRSKTAHHYYLGLFRYAGTDNDADIKVTKEDLEWADKIVCMEMRHRSKLRRKFEGFSKKMVVWNIPDDYDYMDGGLLWKLEERFISLPKGDLYEYRQN